MGANINIFNIICNFFFIETTIFKLKDNIECLVFIPPPTTSYQRTVMLYKSGLANIECMLFICHRRRRICGTNSREY